MTKRPDSAERRARVKMTFEVPVVLAARMERQKERLGRGVVWVRVVCNALERECERLERE